MDALHDREERPLRPNPVKIDSADLVALSALLDVSFDLSPGEFESWLRRLGPGDQRFRQPLRSMFAARESLDDLVLRADALAVDEHGADTTTAVAGELIGPYRLIREVGRGGMGTVWLAERADRTLKRLVAIKLPQLAWGTGIVDRMARERDIGALLAHPHIARLYDAGVDDRGRPYLAIEYVEGPTLDVWCAETRPSIDERLRLCQQVARAVAHAHGRLVVHRDLKPSNIVVTADGSPRLLDFGIAKLLDRQYADDRLTQYAGRALSPGYAAPEQLCDEPVTVAVDVYAIGVILFEMLTGHLPSPVRRGAFATPAYSSHDLEPMLASRRATDRSLADELRGDLDAILAKALKRDPEERYASADALADDIGRYLVGDPVQAQPDRFVYRWSRRLRRHRVAFAGAGIVAVAVIGAASISLMQARQARLASERARVVKEFVVDLFESKTGANGSLAFLPASVLLERGASDIASRFAAQPDLRAELYGMVGRMFFNLGENENVVRFTDQQITAMGQSGAAPTAIAAVHLWLTNVLLPLERNDEAARHARRALELVGNDGGLAAVSHARTAEAMFFGQSDLAAAEVELDAADAAIARGPTSGVERSTVLLARGQWLTFRGEPDAAHERFDEAIALGLAAAGPTSSAVLDAQQEAAKTLIFAGQFEAGRSYLARALATRRLANGPDDPVAALWEAYGTGWLYARDAIGFEEAIGTYRRNLDSLQRLHWPTTSRTVARIEKGIGNAYGHWGDVEQGYARLVQNLDAASADSPLAQWWKRDSLVRTMMLTDHAAEAASIAYEMLALQRQWKQSGDLWRTYDLLASALVQAGRYEEADARLAEYEALPDSSAQRVLERKAHAGPGTSILLVALERGRSAAVVAMTEQLMPKAAVHADEIAWLARARALCDVGRESEGLGLYEQWLPRLAFDRYEASPVVAHWRAEAGLCGLRIGRRPWADHLSRLASAAITRQPGVSPHLKLAVVQLERRLAPRPR